MDYAEIFGRLVTALTLIGFWELLRWGCKKYGGAEFYSVYLTGALVFGIFTRCLSVG